MSEDLHENGELTARYAGPRREGMGLTKAALVMLGVGAVALSGVPGIGSAPTPDGALAGLCLDARGYAVADARFCFPIPESYPDVQAAPLLCAGLIGYRALGMAGDARTLGLYGFGNAAHILTQIAVWEGREVYAFTRPGDAAGQGFAAGLGAVWAGDASTPPPALLDAAIIFAPDGALVPGALKHVRKGGVVVCAGIHMSDIPSFPYADLWGERIIRSVANLTREDGVRLLEVAPRVPVRTEVQVFPLEGTVDALDALREGRVEGGAVVQVR